MTTTIIPIIINNDSRPHSYKQRFQTDGGDELTVEMHTRDEGHAKRLFEILSSSTHWSAIPSPKENNNIHWLAVPFVAAMLGVLVWVGLFAIYVVLATADLVPPMYRVTMWGLHPMVAFTRIAIVVALLLVLNEWIQMIYHGFKRRNKENP